MITTIITLQLRTLQLKQTQSRSNHIIQNNNALSICTTRVTFKMVDFNYLAAKGAESERVEEAALTYFAGVGYTLAGPRLWPFVQEHNLCTVDHIGLHCCDVQKLLNLINPNHIMV